LRVTFSAALSALEPPSHDDGGVGQVELAARGEAVMAWRGCARHVVCVGIVTQLA
jgi:hypothetical protein